MAKDANVTISPAVLFGMWDLWPPGTLFPLPGTIKYVNISIGYISNKKKGKNARSHSNGQKIGG